MRATEFNKDKWGTGLLVGVQGAHQSEEVTWTNAESQEGKRCPGSSDPSSGTGAQAIFSWEEREMAQAGCGARCVTGERGWILFTDGREWHDSF